MSILEGHMKLFILSVMVISSLINPSYAVETTTECIQMREQNQRVNPKENIINTKTTVKNVRSSASGQ
jgi:hypothetical protein